MVTIVGLKAKPELNGVLADGARQGRRQGSQQRVGRRRGAVLALKAANLQRGGGTPPPPVQVAAPPAPAAAATAPVADAAPQVAGLAALLDGLGLSDQLPAAAAWCEANGADSVAAIVDRTQRRRIAEFVESLALKPVKAKQG